MILSLFIKIVSMALSFVSVPIVLNFVDYNDYGIYLTLTSSFALINILDIGLGDGLRNKFAMARAINDESMAKSFVSTTYFINFIIALVIILIYFSFESQLHWDRLLNLPYEKNEEIQSAARFLIIATSSQFFLQAFLNLLKGDQKFISYSIIGFVLNFSSTVTILVMIFMNLTGSIHNLILAFFVVPNIGLLIINIIFFYKKYRSVYPSAKYINWEVVKTLTSLSLKFFFINILSVIALQSINLIVIRNFSPALVVDFNLLFKYYFLLISIAYILFNPIWSTFTSAIAKGEFDLIKVLLNKSLKISFLLIALVPLMIIFANWFICIWTGMTFNSHNYTNLLFGIWVTLVVLSEPYKMLIKGNGELNSYLSIAIIATFFQVLLSIIFIRNFSFGIDGIIFSCIISQLVYLIFFMIKSKNIINRN